MASICGVSYPEPERIDFVVDFHSPTSIKNVDCECCSRSQGRRVKISAGIHKAPPDEQLHIEPR